MRYNAQSREYEHAGYNVVNQSGEIVFVNNAQAGKMGKEELVHYVNAGGVENSSQYVSLCKLINFSN